MNSSLLQRLRHAATLPALETGDGSSLYGNVENRKNTTPYCWHGLSRKGDPAHPRIIFQQTLSGFGQFHAGGCTWKVGPGRAFCAVIPSDHEYCLPKDSPHWSFYWMMIGHSYVVQRIGQALGQGGTILSIPDSSPFLGRSVELFERTRQVETTDEYANEQSTVDWMFELLRLLHQSAHPPDECASLLRLVRTFVFNALPSNPGVEAVADSLGMSRSHFSHYFKSKTGQSPATYMQRVRLREAARRLDSGSDKLEAIAGDTGFSDANHLCKVFRRWHGISPGTYRAESRGY